MSQKLDCVLNSLAHDYPLHGRHDGSTVFRFCYDQIHSQMTTRWPPWRPQSISSLCLNVDFLAHNHSLVAIAASYVYKDWFGNLLGLAWVRLFSLRHWLAPMAASSIPGFGLYLDPFCFVD